MKRARGRKIALRGKLITVSLERRRLPGGFVADMDVVTHPGAVLIVPFSGRDRAILIRQFRPVVGAYIWEFPAGTLGRNEAPLTCAKRELQEEIGCAARHWRKIGFLYPVPGYSTEKIHLFTARGLREARLRGDADEIIKPRSFSFREIRRLLARGKIVDAKTVSALALCGIV